MDGPLEILWEPLDAPGIEEKAEAVTWSRLEVALLKAHIETHVVGLEEIETLARQIRAPLPCVLHQLRNHGVAAVGDLL